MRALVVEGRLEDEEVAIERKTKRSANDHHPTQTLITLLILLQDYNLLNPRLNLPPLTGMSWITFTLPYRTLPYLTNLPSSSGEELKNYNYEIFKLRRSR